MDRRRRVLPRQPRKKNVADGQRPRPPPSPRPPPLSPAPPAPIPAQSPTCARANKDEMTSAEVRSCRVVTSRQAAPETAARGSCDARRRRLRRQATSADPEHAGEAESGVRSRRCAAAAPSRPAGQLPHAGSAQPGPRRPQSREGNAERGLKWAAQTSNGVGSTVQRRELCRVEAGAACRA